MDQASFFMVTTEPHGAPSETCVRMPSLKNVVIGDGWCRFGGKAKKRRRLPRRSCFRFRHRPRCLAINGTRCGVNHIWTYQSRKDPPSCRFGPSRIDLAESCKRGRAGGIGQRLCLWPLISPSWFRICLLRPDFSVFGVMGIARVFAEASLERFRCGWLGRRERDRLIAQAPPEIRAQT